MSDQTLALLCILVSWTGFLLSLVSYKIAYKHGYADGTKDERIWKYADECLMHTPDPDDEILLRATPRNGGEEVNNESE